MSRSGRWKTGPLPSRVLIESGRMTDKPGPDQLSRYFSEMGRRGAKERAKQLSAERRKEIATKASKAAATARTKKAKQKRKGRVSKR